MRVIAGSLGARQFASPHAHSIRPMSEKIRGALFNSLDDIRGLYVLDAFAGSGALSFEAVSRGADKVVAIDDDKSAQLTIKNNIKGLGISNIKLISAKAQSWLRTSKENFDIVLCDPPYDEIQPELLTLLALRVKIGGLIVLSLPAADEFKLGESYDLLSSKNYNDAFLLFYRRIS
jgi:16S rRNA (guanine966-N2)-methyltransferase